MPTAEKKGPRKSKKGGEKAPPPPPVNVTVRDCMMWPEPRAKGQGKGNANKGAASDTKPSVYRSTLIHRDEQLDDEDGHSKMTAPPQPPRRYDGTVIEALRGWPGSREQEEDDAHRYEVARETHPPAKTVDPKSGKNLKKKGKKDASKEESENVFIGDLIHQRYLNEHLEKRRREMEREQRKKEASMTAVKAGRRVALEKVNIKANRTSQLRAIALADKVETSPLDLWKMPRFTKGVNPHLATAGGGGASLQGRAGAGRSDPYDASNGFVGGEGCGGGCYCEHRTTNYVDESEEEIPNGDGYGCDSPMATN